MAKIRVPATFLSVAITVWCLMQCADAAPVDITTKMQASESASSARLDSIERGLNVLQKYVYNLNTEQSSVSKSKMENGINTDEIGEQFRSIRADMESIKQEINQMNVKFANFNAAIEQRLADIETPIKENKQNQEIIESVESRLNDIDIVVAGDVKPIDTLASSVQEQQFKSAYYLMKEKNFDDAKKAFEQFIIDNHKSTLIGAAHYWIGEILTYKQEYDKAAVQYLHGYQAGPNSGRAPDNLLKLAESLFKLGKRQECCVTIERLNKEFPNSSITIKRITSQLAKDAICG